MRIKSYVLKLLDEDKRHRSAVMLWHQIMSEAAPIRREHLQPGLTICSVGYRAKKFLERNAHLTAELNGHVTSSYSWLVLDNNDELGERIDSPSLGVVRQDRREGEGGYEHALGIARLLPRVKTRYVLILDPDCFIVRRNWVSEVTHHMQQSNLAFFGTPINPRRFNSYRYFPYMVCMMIDLAQVPLESLCFLPNVWELKTNLTYGLRRWFAALPKVGLPMFGWLLTERWRTNGWLIKERYGRGHLRFGCAQPVWDHSLLPIHPLSKLVHRLLPDTISPIPKKKNYCAKQGFRATAAFDIAQLGWEEFVWKGQPFAFHVRSAHSLAPDDYERDLVSAIEWFEAH